MKGNRIVLHLLLVVQLWWMCNPIHSTVRATNEDVSLPASFVRVTDMRHLPMQGIYLIGGIGVNERFSLMTIASTLQGVTGTFLQEQVPDVIEVEKLQRCWKITRDENNSVNLQSIYVGDFLYAPDADASTLAFWSDEEPCWQLVAFEDGTFTFVNMSEPERAIGISDSKSKVRFGNYKEHGCDTQKLCLYLLKGTQAGGIEQLQPQHEGWYVPAMECQVLKNTIDEQVWMEDSGYLLNDSTVACEDDWETYRAVCPTEDTFSLYDTAGKSLLEAFGLEPSVLFTMDQGYISTTEAEPRYLVRTPTAALTLSENPAKENAQAVCLRPVAATRDSLLTTDGLKILKGGWSAERLSQVDWAETYALDLTEISLPQQLQVLSTRPWEHNTFVYVRKSDLLCCPENWTAVVACDTENENVLVRTAQIHDKHPLKLHRSFRVQAGMLTYEREVYTDGGWETLVLPFTASKPAQLVLEKCVGWEGSDIRFELADEIQAHQAYIFCNRSEGLSATESLKLVAEDGLVEATEPLAGMLTGVYDTLHVQEEDVLTSPVYLLNSTGDTFVQAAVGSRLLPFRAYLSVENTTGTYRVLHDGVNALPHLKRAKGYEEIHTMWGRKMKPKTISSLPRGVYIIGNRKIIKY